MSAQATDDLNGIEKSRATEQSDTGNALRLVNKFGDRIRYCHEWGDWLIYDGRRWARDRTKEIEYLAKLTVDSIWQEVPGLTDKGDQAAMAKWALSSGSLSRTQAMIAMAQSDRRVAVTADRLDADQWLLNCLNGTLDLRTAELRPHSPGDLITRLAPTHFDWDAECPLWDKFIAKVTRGDDGLATFLRRASGYAATGSVREQCLFFLYGKGENGKTTFLETAGDILGDYAVEIRPDLLIVKNNEEHPTAFTDLEGKRFVRTAETEDGKRLAESLVKSLTGGDTIRARRMRKDFHAFSPTFKIFVAANHKPIIRGTDHGMWRRIHVVPFDHNFADDPEKVLDFKSTLNGERAGILGWFVRGCLEWKSSGLGVPKAVEDATAEYRGEMDVVGNFLDQCCSVYPGDTAIRCKQSDVKAAYLAWCGRAGLTPLNDRKFGDELTTRGMTSKDSNSVRWRYGLKLKSDDPD
jgi:putative DNA primase/helicase